jgi:hypothetical protein
VPGHNGDLNAAAAKPAWPLTFLALALQVFGWIGAETESVLRSIRRLLDALDHTRPCDRYCDPLLPRVADLRQPRTFGRG